jgi:hypothetical protein
LHRAYGNLNFWRGRFDIAESLFRQAAAEHWAGFERRADDPQLFEGSLDIEALVARGALARKRLEY